MTQGEIKLTALRGVCLVNLDMCNFVIYPSQKFRLWIGINIISISNMIMMIFYFGKRRLT